ncbi:MAG: thiamine biosynthesis protein ThiS [Pseudopedobacter saltans]|uniref:Thiamine biosynthesis protein ThiS n=1 Tax=Pseudopedobacter saltans TaxID=151895 RepID=A0A2W5ETZ9_9SPHI|nr:MAG: thiamine biosynthesis protein ThiS [Pseudopedobacter saltans]
MNITLEINKQKTEHPSNISLMQIAMDYCLQKLEGIAVAVNGKVIPKSKLSNYTLRSGDKILIIKATQGG